jgi:hypothetical protein
MTKSRLPFYVDLLAEREVLLDEPLASAEGRLPGPALGRLLPVRG